MVQADLAAGIDRQRQPHVTGRQQRERRRRDADDRGVHPVQRQTAADDRRVAAEPSLPQSFADHRHSRAAGAVVAVDERSAAQRLQTEQRKHRRRERSAGELLRIALARERDRHEPERAHRLEGARLFLPRQVIQHRGGERRQVQLVVAFGDPHETIGVRERQRPQHDRVDDAEDRRVRADAERDREDDGESEERRLPQQTDRVPNIVQQHGGTIIAPACSLHVRCDVGRDSAKLGVGERQLPERGPRVARSKPATGAVSRGGIWSGRSANTEHKTATRMDTSPCA